MTGMEVDRAIRVSLAATVVTTITTSTSPQISISTISSKISIHFSKRKRVDTKERLVSTLMTFLATDPILTTTKRIFSAGWILSKNISKILDLEKFQDLTISTYQGKGVVQGVVKGVFNFVKTYFTTNQKLTKF